MATEPLGTGKAVPSTQYSVPSTQAATPSTGFGRTAARIAAWTTRGLLSMTVIVVSLAFGRQVMHWWHDEPATRSLSSQPMADPFSATGVQTLAFGDQSWTMRRQEVAGDVAQARIALVKEAQSLLPQCSPPGKPADAAEQDLLARLLAQKAVAAEPEKWSVYAWDKSYPAVVGVRTVKPAARPGLPLEADSRRVVLWGMATPHGARAWTIYLFEPTHDGPSVAQGGIPLPPQAKLILAMGSGRQGTIVTFRWENAGGNPVTAAKQFYEDWFARNGWNAQRPWSAENDARQASYRNNTTRADVRLGQDSGVIVLYHENR